MKRTTVYLPEALHDRLRVAVIEQREGSASRLIERLIKAYLARVDKTNERKGQRTRR
jgi:metal-responsive CopG/Arc/MetJ family transcriptional regulator